MELWVSPVGPRGLRGPAAPPTCPPCMSFMLMAFLAPLPFSFLFFFFRQQHFLQMQKQQVRSRRPVTTAMAISAQGGTAHGRPGVSRAQPPTPPDRTREHLQVRRVPRPPFSTWVPAPSRTRPLMGDARG